MPYTNMYHNNTLPSGARNPYSNAAGRRRPLMANPWQQYGLDPSQRLTGNFTGTADQAKQGLLYAASKRDKDISPDEWNEIARATDWTGGGVNSQQYNTALDWLNNRWGPEEQTQEQQAPQHPSNAGLGNEAAMNAYQQQAPVVGVPQSFRHQNPFQQQQQALMARILANPQTMGQQQQDQLAEAQKESAGRMAAQSQGAAAQSFARRGFGPGSGQQAAAEAEINNDLMSQLLSGRRDIAVRAAQQNRADELAALAASQGLDAQGFGQGQAMWNADMQRAQLGLNQINQNRSAALQDRLGLHGMDMDSLNWQQRDRQFDRTHGLDFLRYLTGIDQFDRSFGEGQRQFDQSMGLNWAQLSSADQQRLMAMIMGL